MVDKHMQVETISRTEETKVVIGKVRIPRTAVEHYKGVHILIHFNNFLCLRNFSETNIFQVVWELFKMKWIQKRLTGSAGGW